MTTSSSKVYFEVWKVDDKVYGEVIEREDYLAALERDNRTYGTTLGNVRYYLWTDDGDISKKEADFFIHQFHNHQTKLIHIKTSYP